MQDGNNPYQAPTASVIEHDPLHGNFQFNAPGRRVPSGNGWTWISEAWRLFTAAPVLWIVAAIILFAFNIVFSLIPFIGGLAQILLGPVLMAGLMAFARTIDEGEAADINHLFDGFRQRLSPLLVVGLLYFGMMLVITVITVLFAFALLSGTGIFSQLGGNPTQVVQSLTQNSDMILDFLLVILIFMALMIPVEAAYWFAPALVLCAGLEPFEAMKASFFVCFRNFWPFFIYGLILSLLAFVALIPFGLGLLVLIPVGIASIYTSFKDIFGNAN